MKLGYGLVTCQRAPGDPRTASDLYREALELARACEDAGLDSIWTSEHHFFDDGYMPSLLVVSAAMAAVTRRITIGTAVLLAPLEHPIRLAEDTATVDVLSGGRLVLGVGIGWRAEEFERLGVPAGGLGRRLSETVAVLRGAWGPEPFSYEGRIFRFPATNVTPKPTRQIPILVGGHADAALRRAGRIGDGFMASTTRGDDLADRVGIVREALDRAGRDPAGFTFSVHQPVWVSEDPERDLEDVLSAVWYTRWKYQDMGRAYGRPSTGPLPEPPPLEGAAREQLATSLVLGTPDDVADRLGRLRAVLGDDGHVIARSYLPGMPFDRAMRAVELLGEVRRRLERPATGGPA